MYVYNYIRYMYTRKGTCVHTLHRLHTYISIYSCMHAACMLHAYTCVYDVCIYLGGGGGGGWQVCVCVCVFGEGNSVNYSQYKVLIYIFYILD